MLALFGAAPAFHVPAFHALVRHHPRAGGPVMELKQLQEEVQLLRAELVRKDAIIKSLLGTLETTSITTEEFGFVPSSTPLQDLCQISKEACDAVTPMLKAFYEKISDQRHGGSSKLKSDATYFTIADGIVQHMFIEHLFAGNKFAQIVGEEDESVINILEKPYTVDDLVVPDEFNAIIAATLKEIDQLSTRIDPNLYKTMTVFVDPIDGTREFATAQGQYVTILIGYNDAVGHPSAGIMYRPLTEPVSWAAGAASEDVVMGELDMAEEPMPNGMLITDGKVSPFIVDLIDELGYERVSSVASGNRAMMLLEGKGGAYIRDTGGFAKWDTSAPTAVLEAYGGTMSKLPPFLEDESLVSYTHLKSFKNLDFVPAQSTLTLSNIRDKTAFVKGSAISASDVNSVKEYACMQGLVAVDKAAMKDLPKIRKAMEVVREEHAPTYT
jgi:3'-phosphoadenosine 5'-phosphosulfate (PAPS) 3'-phosphatase